MIPLPTNRRVLTWCCVYQNDDDQTDKYEKLLRRAFALSVFGMSMIGFVVSAAYFVKFVSIDFEESLFALLQMCGECNMVYISIIVFMLRHKISGIFKTISAIYDECKCHCSDIEKLVNLIDI